MNKPKRYARDQNCCYEMKSVFDRLLIDWTWPGKEHLSQRICEQKSPKLNIKENRTAYPQTGTLWQRDFGCD